MKKLLIPFKISLLTIVFCVCLTNAGQRRLGTPAANGLVVQQIILKGKVLSAVNNEPLAGATVYTSTTSAKTDQNGNFTITTDKNTGKLTITYLGYQPKEIQYDISTSQQYTVKLDPQQNTLDETVVIAYGQTTKRFNTGSVGKVTAAEISKQPVANPIAALQGRIPGVEITQQSGRTGANFNVLIRGRSSIANGNDPFYIVDGVPWLSSSLSQIAGSVGSQSPFNNINPQDIQSIEVLKDADATAIYGSRGANGVILITTKKGIAGKTQVDLNIYSGISEVTHIMPLMNTEQYMAMRKEALANDSTNPTNINAPDLLLYDQQRYTDWPDILIGNTGSVSNTQISLSGGKVNTQFRLAGGYRRETNVYPNKEANKRGSGQFNFTHRSENEKFQASLTLNYSNDDNNLPPFDLTSAIYSAPNLKVYNDDGSLSWSENGSANYTNPLAQTLQTFNTTTNNFISNLSVGYSLWEGMQIKLNSGFTNTNLKETRVSPLASYMPSASRQSGQSQFANSDVINWILEPLLNYNKKFGKHAFDIIYGASFQREKLQGRIINASNYSNEALLYTTAGAGTLTALEQYSLYKYQSIFGRVNYQLNNKYIINLTARRDGSSRFGTGRRFANFGAVGLAWIFSEEEIFKKISDKLSFGKVRASYGLTGNDKIGNYQFLDTYGSVQYPYNGVIGLAPQRLFNPDYGWESNRKLEFALELGMFKDRILISSGWFRNRSGNQLLQYSLPSQTGFNGVIRNLPALVENKGWEIEINSTNVQKNSLRWSSSFNITIARNKLLDFPNLETSTYANQYSIGESLNIIKVYPYLGVDQQIGLWTVDLTSGRSNIKDLSTKFYGGFNNSISYKGFQLDLLFQFTKKEARNYIYSLPGGIAGYQGYNVPLALEDRWQNQGDIKDLQRFSASDQSVYVALDNYLLSEGAFANASFIRLKNVAVSYSLAPNWISKIRMKNLRLYMQSQNVFTITGYKGNDPEVASMSVLPPLRNITFGVEAKF